LGKTLSQRRIELYKPVAVFTDPRDLVPAFSFSAPYNWTTIQHHLLEELEAQAA
jgi:hypothetical protein